jgi:hypothetical protein
VRSPGRAPAWHYGAAGVVDFLLAATGAAILFIAIAGGSVFSIAGVQVRLTTTVNPAYIALTLWLLRVFLLPRVPWFGLATDTPACFEQRLPRWDRLLAPATGTAESRGTWWLTALCVGSIGIRIFTAVVHPGFTTGDDVEIHEMTIGTLLGHEWPVWNIRSALYPMMVIYPAQLAGTLLGGSDVSLLVLSGRLMVIAVSTLSVWLSYRIAFRLTNSTGVAILAAALVAGSRLHLGYGSSEEPRAVATPFILAGFYLLLTTHPRSLTIAAILLGVGGSLRFAELMFIIPAASYLLMEGRTRHSALFTCTAALTAFICLAVADWFYWGVPLSSLWNIVNYTLIQGQSSSGFQPAWHYLVTINQWSNFVIVGLWLVAAVVDKRLAIWTVVPLAMLSALPHKEVRYVIPLHPLVSVAAAVGLAHLAKAGQQRKRISSVITGALVAVAAIEVGNWRVRRTDEAIAIARTLAASAPAVVAAEQPWRFGGRLYWPPLTQLVDITTDPRPAFEAPVDAVLLIAPAETTVLDALRARGFQRSEGLSSADYATLLRAE